MTQLSLGSSTVFSPLWGREFLEDVGEVLEVPVLGELTLATWGRVLHAWRELMLDAWEEVLRAWDWVLAQPAFLPGWGPVLLAWGMLDLTAWEEVLPAWGELTLAASEEALPAWDWVLALPALLLGWEPVLLTWGRLALTSWEEALPAWDWAPALHVPPPWQGTSAACLGEISPNCLGRGATCLCRTNTSCHRCPAYYQWS